MFHIELKGEYFSLRRRRRGDKSVCCVFQSKKMQTLRMKEIPFLQVSATGPGPYSSSCAAPKCSKIFQSFEEESDKSVFERDSVLYKQV